MDYFPRGVKEYFQGAHEPHKPFDDGEKRATPAKLRKSGRKLESGDWVLLFYFQVGGSLGHEKATKADDLAPTLNAYSNRTFFLQNKRREDYLCEALVDPKAIVIRVLHD